MSERELYIALNLIPKLGSVRIKNLVDEVKSYELFLRTERETFLHIPGINRNICDTIIEYRQRVNPYIEIDKAERLGVKIVTLCDPEYPNLLKNIYDPPPVLYMKGNLSILDYQAIALVGTRKATFYGKSVAMKLAKGLAENKINVVSGMARGIDSYAHKGALEAGGPTTAVLGCGLDIVYPPENVKLAEKICESGCLLTPFPIGTKPLATNFPARNRIISGLSLGTVVIEAAEKSGSLITADFSLEQGREVFAVPGSIMSPYSRGPHKLLKQGAKLVESVDDIIEELNLNMMSVKNKCTNAIEQHLSQEESAVLSLIDYEPTSVEQILMKSNKKTKESNAILSMLEIKGVITILPGGYVVRTGK